MNKLPGGWNLKPLMDCLEREDSSNDLKIQQKNFLEEGKFPIIDQGDNFIAGYTNDESKVLTEDRPVIIFGDHTRILKYIDFPFALGADGVKVLVPKKEINPKYFYYSLKNLKIESHGYSRHYKFLKEKEIVVPPLPIQKEIVEKLEKVEKIKQYREEADKLTKDYLQSVFYEMFGDPNPIKNKNFEGKNLNEVAQLAMGGTPNTSHPEYYNGKINWMKSGDIKGDLIRKIPQTITEEGFKKSNAKLYPKGTVVIALNGQGKTRGTTAILGIATTSNQSVVGIMINTKFITSEYLHYNFKLRYNEIRNLTGDDDRSGLNLSILRNFKIPLPPLPTQQKFTKIVEQVEKIKEYQKGSREEIDKLFDSFMSKAFKGELII